MEGDRSVVNEDVLIRSLSTLLGPHLYVCRSPSVDIDVVILLAFVAAHRVNKKPFRFSGEAPWMQTV